MKPLVTWNLEEVASVCRERCGGQGYLSCNRFGVAIASAHAGMTAEGDNAVLMQKVIRLSLSLLVDPILQLFRTCRFYFMAFFVQTILIHGLFRTNMCEFL